jgi:malignant T-cell-amplified sequence
MKTYNLSKTARSDFLQKFSSLVSDSEQVSLSSKLKDLKIAELDDQGYAIIFDKDLRMYVGRKNDSVFFPLLKDEQFLPKLPSVVVDAGAIKFVCNGANIMRPGIVNFPGSQFSGSDLVVVKEITHSKAIAVGRAMFDEAKIHAMSKGPAIENLHYVGDKFWEALKILEA